MNDKELFWSLISPHLVDRPYAHGRTKWGLEYIMNQRSYDRVNYDFTKFIQRNHKFVMPSDLYWRDDFKNYEVGDIEYVGYDVLPFERYPNSMIIVQGENKRVGRLFINLRNTLVEMSLTRIQGSELDYVVGLFNFHDLNTYNKLYPLNTKQYAVLINPPKFLNWIEDPFHVK